MPFEVIEDTDPLASLIRFETSSIYEMMLSLQTVLRPGRHSQWRAQALAALPDDFWDALDVLYRPFSSGTVFFELGVDYPDHHDIPGFVEYVRAMDPVDFVFYVVGRIITRQQIAATGLDRQVLRQTMLDSDFGSCWVCDEVPLGLILEDVSTFQHRLADFWLRYWNEFFQAQIGTLRARWDEGLQDKMNLLARAGTQALFEQLGYRKPMPTPLPPDQPYTEIVMIPLALPPKPAFMFYGYGNITVLFDSARTTVRLAEIERDKEQALALLKALGDSSRLEILRLIAQHDGQLHGKKIAHLLDLSASAVSRHLNQLKDAGLITEESADNRTITYQFERDALTALPELLLEVLYN